MLVPIKQPPLKRLYATEATVEQKEAKRAKFRRCSAVEPIISHVKHDYRMARNYLKGFIGDQINLLMAACAWNLKKWMNDFIYALFFTILCMLQISYLKQWIGEKRFVLFSNRLANGLFFSVTLTVALMS
jgi:IS5 family transposase